MAKNSYTSYHPDSYKGGATSVTVFAKNKTAAAKAATPNAGSSLGKGTLTSVNGKPLKNAAAVQKAVAQTGETNKIQKNSVKVIAAPAKPRTRSEPIPLKASRPHEGASNEKFDNSWPTPRVKVNSNPVKTSGLQGREVGNMDHQGGHGLQGGAISAFGGGGLAEQTR